MTKITVSGTDYDLEDRDVALIESLNNLAAEINKLRVSNGR